MRTKILLLILAFAMLGCLKIRNITVKVLDVDTNNPVSGIQIIITDIQRHSSGNAETVLYTDDNGVATVQLLLPKKDLIKIQLNGKNGYAILGKGIYYYNYQRRINVFAGAKK
ncbi:MAG: hypothetical protein K0S53_13 [Bacteroidetes bacterium]|jgi:hypothetical protein|nr:hypothetical protein [Bacteroidota bacterium]